MGVDQLKQKIAKLLSSGDKNNYTLKGENKNMELLYKLRIEINRLLTSENFSSKLRKLTSFMSM